jgi:peptidoglycan/LPS O-acetylase OafA/YrhL
MGGGHGGDQVSTRTPIPALHGLRGVAVMAILLFHSSHLDGGYLSVDLLFVLSGYLITALLLAEHDRAGAIHLGAFWARRARRMVPALLLMLAGTMAAVTVIFGVDAARTTGPEAIASLLGVSNWYTIANASPFPAIFQHTWTLSIEAQFYLLWPLIVVIVLRRSPTAASPIGSGPIGSGPARALLGVSIGGALAGTALMAVTFTGSDSLARVYFGTDTRAAPILVGAALACAARLHGPVAGDAARRALEIGAWFCLGATILAWMHVTRPTAELYHRGGYLLVAVAGAVMVAAAGHPGAGLFSRALSVRPLVWLGLLSYAIYLWHWPIFWVFNAERLHLQEWPLLGAQLVITVAVATATYIAVERPVREQRVPFTRRSPAERTGFGQPDRGQVPASG